MSRTSFVFYKSFYDALHSVKNKELKSDLYDAICELALNENVIEFTEEVGQIIMKLVSPQILANNRRFINGCKGGNPNFKKGQRNPYYPEKKDNQDNQKITTTLPNEEWEMGNEKLKMRNERESYQDNSSTPTLTQILEYASSLGINDEEYPERFFNYYASIGWVNSKGLPIINWKLVFKNWYKKDLEAGNIKNPNQKEYDTETFFTEKETGRLFQYDLEGNKNYVGNQ